MTEDIFLTEIDVGLDKQWHKEWCSRRNIGNSMEEIYLVEEYVVRQSLGSCTLCACPECWSSVNMGGFLRRIAVYDLSWKIKKSGKQNGKKEITACKLVAVIGILALVVGKISDTDSLMILGGTYMFLSYLHWACNSGKDYDDADKIYPPLLGIGTFKKLALERNKEVDDGDGPQGGKS